ncbi:plastin-3-like isoform X2 [Tubulanus polymorphus]|uniref:plastin-3-like isoform X2 n=1 Tax=Tubulanus polymorphus TaxID=672921 RepID=UPI003DA55649
MADMETVTLNEEELEEITTAFDSIDVDASGFIEISELKDAFEKLHLRIPSYEIRDLIRNHDSNSDGKLSKNEFIKTAVMLRKEKNCNFTKLLSRQSGIETIGGLSEQTAEGVTHSLSKAEKHAFTDWINRKFASDPDCKPYLPIKNLFEDLSDGIVLCKMINCSCPDTIDERVMNKDKLTLFTKHENQTLVLQSAQGIGCNIVNIGPQDLIDGRQHLVLGLVWQIIRFGLLNDINLHDHAELAALLLDGETLADLQALSPEELLMRWVNYHLEKSGEPRRIRNFNTDIMDSEIYLHLLSRIAPAESNVVTSQAFQEQDHLKRADLMLREADKIQCRMFVSPQDVVSGNQKLNLAFVANLFNNYPALDVGDRASDVEVAGETREEKTYRNWINSTSGGFIYHLYSDLCDGLVILKMFDKIEPSCVNWSKVNLPPYRQLSANFKKLENCRYCIELGKGMDFSLVGIDGGDIATMNSTLTLALLWQMMRAYTLNILMKVKQDGAPVQEKEIIAWANEKLIQGGFKHQINNFKDPALKTGVILVELVAAIKKNIVNFDLLSDGNSDEDYMANAKYAIGVARKAGAAVYALPEDIVEVNPKMLLTMFAFLMLLDINISTGSNETRAI